ncbi:hypothetical protein TYRP_006951 [Tyrophagus putrescentiae]|nr:hypothetical protein TYRP_006951 [Tyrophagus putrescentiae]
MPTTQQLYIIITPQKLLFLFRNTQHDHNFHHHNIISSFSSDTITITTTTSTDLYSSDHSKTSSSTETSTRWPLLPLSLLQSARPLLPLPLQLSRLQRPRPLRLSPLPEGQTAGPPPADRPQQAVPLGGGKAAAWFTLFGALAFAATYQLKVRRDERMYGIRRGPKDFTISSLIFFNFVFISSAAQSVADDHRCPFHHRFPRCSGRLL